jgi:hypothetical protein
MKFDGISIIPIAEITRLPSSQSGCGGVNFNFTDSNVVVDYEYFDDAKEVEAVAKLSFEFVVAISIESENNSRVGLPERSETLYGFKTDVREGFRGFQLWLSDNYLITVVCNKVVYDGLEY